MPDYAPGNPGWVHDLILWQVFPFGFCGVDQGGQDRTPTHNLRRITHWLDYAVDLGVTGIQLGPIWDSDSHGYNVRDYLKIDERLGDEQDFIDLCNAAHEKGLKIILDGVFNHTSVNHWAFQKAMEFGPDCPESWWYHINWEGENPTFEQWHGMWDMAKLNHDQPAVQDHVTDAMNYWLDRGADGWRLDVAHDVPAWFWELTTNRVRAFHPEAWFVGEITNGDYHNMVMNGRLNSVTQYSLHFALSDAISDNEIDKLAGALDEHNHMLEYCRPLTFIGNHDQSRIASQIPDWRNHVHAAVILLTIGGVPSIYYGDERGYEAWKSDGWDADAPVRPAYPETPSDLPQEGWDVYEGYQHLVGLRRRCSWLHDAQTTTLRIEPTWIAYETRHENDRLVVCLNFGDEPVAFDYDGLGQIQLGTAFMKDDGWVEVPGHAWGILS